MIRHLSTVLVKV